MNNNYLVFSIRDKLSGFGQLMLEPNAETAKRNFAYALSTGINKFSASDFDLYQIGSYDISSGQFIAFSVPDFVASASEVMTLYGGV